MYVCGLKHWSVFHDRAAIAQICYLFCGVGLHLFSIFEIKIFTFTFYYTEKIKSTTIAVAYKPLKQKWNISQSPRFVLLLTVFDV